MNPCLEVSIIGTEKFYFPSFWKASFLSFLASFWEVETLESIETSITSLPVKSTSVRKICAKISQQTYTVDEINLPEINGFEGFLKVC